MSDLIDVQVRFDTFTLPIPTVNVGESELSLPTLPGVDLPSIPVPDVTVGREFVSLPEAVVPVPRVQVEPRRLALPSIPGFPYVRDLKVDIRVEFGVVDIPFTSRDPTLPVDVELIGPSIDFGFFDPPDLPDVTVPEIDVSIDQVRVGGGTVTVPDVRVRPDRVDLPDIQPTRLPSVPLPTVQVDVDGVEVIDPRSIRVEVTTRLGRLRQAVLSPVPDGLLSDPGSWVFETVFTEAARRVGDGLADRLKALLDGLLDDRLSQSTKQRLRERGRE